MAKIKGGLFSLGASGTVAHMLTFNQGDVVQVARRSPRSRAPASAKQVFYRSKFSEAVLVWRGFDSTKKDEWKAVAALSGQQVFAKFWREWMAQHSTTAVPPFIPMR